MLEYSLDVLLDEAEPVPMRVFETQGSIIDAVLLEVEEDGVLKTIPWAIVQEGPFLYLRSDADELPLVDFDPNSAQLEKIVASNGVDEGLLVVDSWLGRHFSLDQSEIDNVIWEHVGDLTKFRPTR